MTYRYNAEVPRTRLRQPAFYNKKRGFVTAIISQFHYTATSSSEITMGGTASVTISINYRSDGTAIVVADAILLCKFDENTGTSPSDSYQNCFLLASNINSSNWTTGAPNVQNNVSALKFNQTGANAEFVVFTPSHLNYMPYGNPYTIATWIKVDNINTAELQIIAAMASNSSASFLIGIVSGIIIAFYKDDANETGCIYVLNETDHQGKWFHLAVTFMDPTTKIYINGVLVATYDNTVALNTNYPGLNLFLLGGGTDTGFEFHGTLDDVRMYARALSANEINRISYGKEYAIALTTVDLKQQVDATQIVISGISSVRLTSSYNVVTSDIALSGISSLRNSYNYNTNTTQIVISGISSVRLTSSYNVVTSDIALSGISSLRNSYNYNTNTTQVLLSGISSIVCNYHYNVSTTDVLIAGNASFRRLSDYYFIASGSVILSGQSVERVSGYYKPSGGVVCGGELLVNRSYSFIGSSGCSLSGQSKERITLHYNPSGGITCAGGLVISEIHVASGGITLSGQALAAFFSPFDDNFGFIFQIDYDYLNILSLIIKDYYVEVYDDLLETFGVLEDKIETLNFKASKKEESKSVAVNESPVIYAQALQPRERRKTSIAEYAKQVKNNYKEVV